MNTGQLVTPADQTITWKTYKISADRLCRGFGIGYADLSGVVLELDEHCVIVTVKTIIKGDR